LLQLFQRRQLSDTEYIEQVRKFIRWWDHWRCFGVALHLAIIAAAIWFGFCLVDLLRKLQALFPLPNAQIETLVLIGVLAGMQLGFIVHGAIWGLIQAIMGLRNERLLIKYHDRLSGLLGGNGANSDSKLQSGVGNSPAGAEGTPLMPPIWPSRLPSERIDAALQRGHNRLTLGPTSTVQ
jgi:hypothetical protein